MTYESFEDRNENFILEKFIDWLNGDGNNYEIIEKPNPPDAIIEDSHTNKRIWVEVTICFFNEEFARDHRTYHHEYQEHIPMNTENGFCNMDENFAQRFYDLVEQKTNKTSYRQCYNDYGGGYLVVRLVSPWFDESTLDAIESYFDDSMDCGMFSNIIICYGYNADLTFQHWHSC